MTPGEFSAYAEMTPPEVMKGVVIVCKIPLLARRTRPSARATIGYLVYKGSHFGLLQFWS